MSDLEPLGRRDSIDQLAQGDAVLEPRLVRGRARGRGRGRGRGRVQGWGWRTAS